jgi:DNA-binding transcriptional LysR family regulator
MRSSQIDFIVELVAAGMGIGFLPQMIAEQRKHRDVRIHKIKDADVNWNHGPDLAKRRIFVSCGTGLARHCARAKTAATRLETLGIFAYLN